jgi:hypothetical protein
MTIYLLVGMGEVKGHRRITDAPHQNTPRIKNTRIRISPGTLIINYSTTTYPNRIILNPKVESIELLNLYNSVFLSKAL